MSKRFSFVVGCLLCTARALAQDSFKSVDPFRSFEERMRLQSNSTRKLLGKILLTQDTLARKFPEDGDLRVLYDLENPRNKWKTGRFDSKEFWNHQLNGELYKRLIASEMQLAQLPDFPTRSLKPTEANLLIQSTAAIASQEFKEFEGVCYLRASHIASKIFQKNPNIPVLKLWIVGKISRNGSPWKYHNVTLAPIKTRTGLSWGVLDPLFPNAGPLQLADWMRQLTALYNFETIPELFLTDTVRSNAGSNDFELLMEQKYQDRFEALIRADTNH